MAARNSRPLPAGAIALLLPACGLLMAGGARAGDTAIILGYNERPPYAKTGADGSVSGYTATPAARAFTEAGIAYQWVRMALPRQLEVLKENRDPVCFVGRYKAPDRGPYANFTLPISQDSKMVGLANSHFKPAASATLEQVLANPAATVLVKQSAYYGPYLQNQLDTMRAHRMDTPTDFGNVMKMIRIGRADLTFVPIEEVTYYMNKGELSPSEFNVLEFPAMPAGEKRYIMCNKKVGDEVVQRLNGAIAKWHNVAPPPRVPAK